MGVSFTVREIRYPNSTMSTRYEAIYNFKIFCDSTGNNTVPGKVATTCTEDGHKQTAKTSTTI